MRNLWTVKQIISAPASGDEKREGRKERGWNGTGHYLSVTSRQLDFMVQTWMKLYNFSNFFPRERIAKSGQTNIDIYYEMGQIKT